MSRKLLRDLLLCAITGALSGCASKPATLPTVPMVANAIPSPGSSNPSPPLAATAVTEPSVYIVGDSFGPDQVLILPKSAATSAIPTAFNGELPSVDAAGNIYFFDYSAHDIDVLSPGALTKPPVRFLPVGQNTNIDGLYDMMASQSGEIYVYDMDGIAVFSPTGTGNDKPVRVLSLAPLNPSEVELPTFTIDRAGTLYLSNTGGSLSVYAPNASGGDQPVRTIQGPLTHLPGAIVTSLATDSSGNLYVLGLFRFSETTNGVQFTLYEFSADADGNVAPIASMAVPLYPYFYNDAVAIAPDDSIYVSAGTAPSVCEVVKFAPTASGGTSAPTIVSVYGCSEGPLSRIAVN